MRRPRPTTTWAPDGGPWMPLADTPRISSPSSGCRATACSMISWSRMSNRSSCIGAPTITASAGPRGDDQSQRRGARVERRLDKLPDYVDHAPTTTSRESPRTGPSWSGDFGASYDFLWSNITANGTIVGSFGPDLASLHGTPMWWLAQHLGGSYTNDEDGRLRRRWLAELAGVLRGHTAGEPSLGAEVRGQHRGRRHERRAVAERLRAGDAVPEVQPGVDDEPHRRLEARRPTSPAPRRPTRGSAPVQGTLLFYRITVTN